MRKEKIVQELQEKEITDVSSYIEKINRYINSCKNEDYIFLYRGEPEVYDTPCQANIFRRKVMEANRYFEKSLFDAMRQNHLTNERRYLDNAIDAQHGEFPSRLLDVTYNCLTALYFAVTPYYHREEDVLDKKDGMVYLFLVDEIFSPSAQNINANYDAIINRDQTWFTDKIIFEKNHKFVDHTKLNTRIIAQQGAFLLFQGNDASDLPAYMTYGIKIPGKAKNLIRRELFVMFGIHTGTIYPEINNLVKDISEKSKKLNTENFSWINELNYTLKTLKKEMDYYLDYIIDNRKEEDLYKILIQVEKVINSYRTGLLDFIREFPQNPPEEFKKEELRNIISRYNYLIKEFMEELKNWGIGSFSCNELEIQM